MRATTSQYEIQVAKITLAQSKPLHFSSNISNSLLSIVNIKLISERRQSLFMLHCNSAAHKHNVFPMHFFKK